LEKTVNQLIQYWIEWLQSLSLLVDSVLKAGKVKNFGADYPFNLNHQKIQDAN